MSIAPSRRLRFDTFELEVGTGQLFKDGARIRLQDQPARLLTLLASNAGQLVTRTEIQKALWEDGEFVEFEHAVNTAMKKVRIALEDDSDNPRIIETIPRKGYRFILPVESAADEILTIATADPVLPMVLPRPEVVVAAPLPEQPPFEPEIASAHPPPPAITLRSSLTPWILVGLLLVAVLILGVSRIGSSDAALSDPALHVEVITPPTLDPTSLAISPDGLKIVFVAISEGRPQLRLRMLDTGVEKSLPGTDGALFPFWSPTSRSVGFFADGSLKRTDIDGGLPRILAEATAGRGGSWNGADVILFAQNTGGPIYRVSATNGNQPVPVTTVMAGSHRHPRFLPDDRHFLYLVTGTGEERGVYVGDLAGSEPPKRLPLLADAAAEYASGKQLLFVSQGALFAQSFDPSALKLSGEPIRVAEQVTVDAAMNLAAVAASASGTIIYRAGSAGGQKQFVWFDRRGRETERVGEPDGSGVMGPSISPDGRHVAMYRTVDGNSDIWLLELDRGVRERLTIDAAGEVNPVWTPDRRIAFSSNRDGAYDLYIKSISGTETERVLKTDEPKSASSWSRDGRYLLYRTAGPDTAYDIWALPFDAAGKPGKEFPVVQTKAEEREAEFSPNGKWIAYQSNASGRSEVYVQRFPPDAHSLTVPVSTNGGAQARWGSDSELFYIALDGQLMSVAMEYRANGTEIWPEPPVALFPTRIGGAVHSNDRQQYVVSPDGKRFLMNTLTEASSPITVILNWKSGS